MRGPNPNLDRLGIRSRVGPVPARSSFPAGSLRGAERPLLHQFIGTQTLTFSARSIRWPGTGTFAAPPTGSLAWYTLASWTIPDDIGQEAALVGYRLELGATNYNAATQNDRQFASGLTWGTQDGYGAAVVVGVNIPGALNTWSNGPLVPFVANPTTGGTQNNLSQSNSAPWLTFHYAPGSLGDTSPQIVYRLNQTTPLATLLTGGTRLSVACVFRQADPTTWGASAGDIPVRIHGELTLASTITRGQYTE